ncbi:15531_t:CDS:2 [Gigaspora margarita]|uniref:15531_t:CDS:1 n=1 Tax=Gigaspora margarita TaxID=4874 RepID=A0ABN7UDG7_GIGMA|nr:15531_t:CDS:2 [Gigaspora margarita]
MNDIRKDFVSKTYFELIYYSELYSSNYDEAIKLFNKLLYENSELTQEEKQSCQERTLRNVEREKELFKRGEPIKCNNCNLTRYSTRYCENCIIKYLRSFFGTWTSGSKIIDEFLRECQSNSGLPLHIMEWIPSDQLEDITPLVKGGISTVYIATWKRGAILDFNESKQEFVYSGSQKVVLKSLNSPDNPYEMIFNEAKKFVQIRSGDIVNAYGITKIKTSDDHFAIVMNYFSDGNLRDYLIKNQTTLSLKDRIFAIWRICLALSNIHQQDLIHCNLHSRNILLYTNRCLLSGLGSCRPVNNESADKLYGAVPYMAPELLKYKKYSKSTDIYGLGVLIWEIFAISQPFDYIPDSYQLAREIVCGLKLQMVPVIPNKIQSLVYECMDADPLKRPTIEQVLDTIKNLYKEIYESQDLITEYEKKKSYYSPSKIVVKPYTPVVHKSSIIDLNEKIL